MIASTSPDYKVEFTEISSEQGSQPIGLFVPPSLEPLSTYKDFTFNAVSRLGCRLLVPRFPGFGGRKISLTNATYDGTVEQRGIFLTDFILAFLGRHKRRNSIETMICCGENALAGLTTSVLLHNSGVSIRSLVLVDPSFRCLISGIKNILMGHAMCQLGLFDSFVKQRLFPLITKNEGTLKILDRANLSDTAMMFRMWHHGTKFNENDFRSFANAFLTENVPVLVAVSKGDPYCEKWMTDKIIEILGCGDASAEKLRARVRYFDQTHRPVEDRSCHLLVDHSEQILDDIENLLKFTETE